MSKNPETDLKFPAEIEHYLQVAVNVPIYSALDYKLPALFLTQAPQIGQRVCVPFRNQQKTGIILGITQQSHIATNKLKSITSLLDEQPILPNSLLKLATWLSDYYHYPIGEVFAVMLPTLIRQGEALPINLDDTKQSIVEVNATHFSLNEEQQAAVNQVLAQQQEYHTWVLDGITGSGKTEVYLQLIAQVLQQGKQALVLVPEIGLTPQTIQRFAARFNAEIVILHSNLTDKQRAQAWLKAQSGKAHIIIGTRSAIFTPMLNPGIIIIDESHDLSFKQQDSLRYHARDVAIKRAQIENIPVILGSATHSLETLLNAARHRFSLIKLTQRAGNAVPPQFELLDIRNHYLREGISPKVIELIELHLQRKEQVLLFINRRGFAPALMCHHCGWLAECNRCDAKYTYHLSPLHLHCHHCDNTKPIPAHCPKCQSKNLIPLGLGTVKVETVLSDIFPDAVIVRVDKDSTRRKQSMDKLIDKINNGKADILIGTQMLAKGHHFANVTLVVILDGDSGFFASDFRATEYFAQTLTQVAGRCGRENKPGHVIIQTRNPDHPSLQQLIREGYQAFCQSALQERQQANLPPFSYLSLINARSKNTHTTHEFLEQVKALAIKDHTPAIKILGPIAAPICKRAGNFHYQLLLQTNDRILLKQFLTTLIKDINLLPMSKKIRWSIDVDPVDLM